jgi:hypothetical protein
MYWTRNVIAPSGHRRPLKGDDMPVQHDLGSERTHRDGSGVLRSRSRSAESGAAMV